MAKHIDLRTEEQKRDAKSPARILERSIHKRVWKLADAIGALRTAAQIAVMSSLVMEIYTGEGQSAPKPTVRYRDFVGRTDPLPKRKATPAIEALRRSILKRVRKLVKLAGPTYTMNVLIWSADIAIESERDWNGLKPGPEVLLTDFSKRADGTSLL